MTTWWKMVYAPIIQWAVGVIPLGRHLLEPVTEGSFRTTTNCPGYHQKRNGEPYWTWRGPRHCAIAPCLPSPTTQGCDAKNFARSKHGTLTRRIACYGYEQRRQRIVRVALCLTQP